MAAPEVQIINEGGEIVVSGSIGAPGATADYVLTADGEGGTSFAPGGGSQPGGPVLSGDGSPQGVTAAAGIGQQYVDTTNGALYIALVTGYSGWVAVGGHTFFAEEIAGFGAEGAVALMQDDSGSVVQIDSGNVSVVVNALGNTVELDGYQGIGIEISDNGEVTTVGFFGASPVAQPAGSGITTVAELVSALQSLGLLGS